MFEVGLFSCWLASGGLNLGAVMLVGRSIAGRAAGQTCDLPLVSWVGSGVPLRVPHQKVVGGGLGWIRCATLSPASEGGR
eukprot:349873-Chlamydomonas_euryale.AAC.6